MSTLLGVATLLVALFCLARWRLPVLRVEGHARDLEAWHLVMAGSMTAMLLAPLSRTVSMVGLALFAGGLVWSLVRVARRVTTRAHLRLALGSAAMSVMLVPAVAPAASSVAGMAGSGMAGTVGGHAHAGHTMAAADGAAWWEVPDAVLVGLLVALGLVLVASTVRLLTRAGPLPVLLDACCEAVMALGMGYMLLAMI